MGPQSKCAHTNTDPQERHIPPRPNLEWIFNDLRHLEMEFVTQFDQLVKVDPVDEDQLAKVLRQMVADNARVEHVRNGITHF